MFKSNTHATRSRPFRSLIMALAAAATLLAGTAPASAGHDRARPRNPWQGCSNPVFVNPVCSAPVFANPVFTYRPAPPIHQCGASDYQRGLRAGHSLGYREGYADAAAGMAFCGTPTVFPPGCDCHFRKGFVRGFDRGYRDGFEAGQCSSNDGWSVSWSWSWPR